MSVEDDKHWVIRCPFCKCYKKDSLPIRGTPSINDLGCYTCENKTCKYLWGQEEYKKHLLEVHNVN